MTNEPVDDSDRQRVVPASVSVALADRPQRRLRPGPRLPTYWDHTRRPIVNLLFLAPLVVAYAIGGALYDLGSANHRPLAAASILEHVSNAFGISVLSRGVFLILVVLLFWHLKRREDWRIPPATIPVMLAESTLLALPLLVGGGLLLTLVDFGGGRVIRSIGAGLYEEFVFRLLLLGGLLWGASSIARLPRATICAVGVMISAVLFAWLHVVPYGAEPFDATRMMFRVLAGGYLGAIFLFRGIGICTGAHIAYNLLALA